MGGVEIRLGKLLDIDPRPIHTDFTKEFIPFNGGPRICIGRKSLLLALNNSTDIPTEQFALTEASYLTVRMLQKFEHMEARDSRPWTEFYTLVACSKYGTLVGLTPAST
jgi:hypothetical protein